MADAQFDVRNLAAKNNKTGIKTKDIILGISVVVFVIACIAAYVSTQMQ